MTLAGSTAPLAAPAYELGPGEVFTLLFIVVGPLKLLGEFVHESRGLDERELRALALRSTLVAALGLIAGGLVGRALLAKWHVDVAVMGLAMGLIFLAVAFRLVLREYAVPAAREEPRPPPPSPFRVAFPSIAPPYGVAAVILLFAQSRDLERSLLVGALVLANLALDLLAMRFGRSLTKGAGAGALQLLGAVLGVLQVALALRIVLAALAKLGLVQGE